jgi:hypothetical protein
VILAWRRESSERGRSECDPTNHPVLYSNHECCLMIIAQDRYKVHATVRMHTLPYPSFKRCTRAGWLICDLQGWAIDNGLRSSASWWISHGWTVWCLAPLFWPLNQELMGQITWTVQSYRAIYSDLTAVHPLQCLVLTIYFRSDGPIRKAWYCLCVPCPQRGTGSQSINNSSSYFSLYFFKKWRIKICFSVLLPDRLMYLVIHNRSWRNIVIDIIKDGSWKLFGKTSKVALANARALPLHVF